MVAWCQRMRTNHDPLESRVGMAVAATVEPMPIGDAG